MTTPNIVSETRQLVTTEIQTLLAQLGKGKTQGTAYDTAWGARLSAHYPNEHFDAAIEWLRRNQNEDGSWGGTLTHYHDRYISTLAAIVALKEVGRHPRDKRRIQRGENALWKLIGRLGRDDSDTVGFPILAASLASEAAALGLDVPHAPIRYAAAYRRKVEHLLMQPRRNWLHTTLSFSFEALRDGATENDDLLETNDSVSVSLSATAAYLMTKRDERALQYLRSVAAEEDRGALPAVWPIDIFEIAWSLNYLRAANAIHPDQPEVRKALNFLWAVWRPEAGVSSSSHWRVPEIDDTAACYAVLNWGGYPANESVFNAFEMDDYFWCYQGETNPSLSAHVRLISALRSGPQSPRNQERIQKAVGVLYRLDENGSFWWDKWHASPYYVTSAGLRALHGIADDLAWSRYKWILRTQNENGGWGYYERSTPEETAYCLQALLYWDRNVERVDASRLDAAAAFVSRHMFDPAYVPLWIGKSLYTPYYPVKAAILSALFEYASWSDEG